jgi:hypothetical protein
MLYGYSVKQINEYGLHELKEVSVQADPVILRQIGTFFLQMADLMDRGGFERCSHRHIGSVIEGWDRRFSQVDLIVLAPDGYHRDPPIVRTD